MNRIFLGPLLHWLLIIALLALGWIAGGVRLHVSQFNLYLILLGLTTLVVLVVVLKSSPPSARVTRDPLEDPDDQAGGPAE